MDISIFRNQSFSFVGFLNVITRIFWLTPLFRSPVNTQRRATFLGHRAVIIMLRLQCILNIDTILFKLQNDLGHRCASAMSHYFSCRQSHFSILRQFNGMNTLIFESDDLNDRPNRATRQHFMK